MFWVVVAMILGSQLAMAGGDIEYGEYLSSECVTCHQNKLEEGQIPVIHGMNEQGFVEVMFAYRSKLFENATMQTIAARLTDEDIKALAAYFASLPAPE